METVELISKIIEAVVLVGACIVGRYVIPMVKEKVGTQKLAEITMWVQTFVKYAEQVFAPGTGDEKLALVTEHISNKAKELGVELSDADIRALIEEAVFVINKELKNE